MSFRGINTTVIQIRRQVFTEVARMAYANVKGEQANHLMRKIPYTIIPGEEGKLRKDIFLERAIVEERVRLAMGLPTRRMDEHNSVVSRAEPLDALALVAPEVVVAEDPAEHSLRALEQGP